MVKEGALAPSFKFIYPQAPKNEMLFPTFI